MATTTVTYPAEFPQPKEIVRQGAIVALVLLIGIGLGMVLDTGRQTVAVEASQLTQGQQATVDRLTAQAGASQIAGSPSVLDQAIARAEAAHRAVLTAEQLQRTPFELSTWAPAGVPVGVSAAEHGEFTPMANRGEVNVEGRFAGADGNFDPDIDPAVLMPGLPY